MVEKPLAASSGSVAYVVANGSPSPAAGAGAVSPAELSAASALATGAAIAAMPKAPICMPKNVLRSMVSMGFSLLVRPARRARWLARRALSLTCP